MTKQTIPKIRFEEFDDEWGNNTINNISERFDNLRIPITASDRVEGKTPYYGANGIQGFVEGYTHDGEFILIAEDGANDLKNYPIQYVNGKIWANNHVHVLSGNKNKINNLFFKNCLRTVNFKKYLVGGSRYKLNSDILMKMSITFPSLPEQQAIGSLFNTLDNLLTSYKDNLSHYQSFKATMLSKMFPRDGQTTPEIRLEGFEGEWGMKVFSEIIDRVSESSDSETLPKIEFEDIISGQGRLNKDVSKKFDKRKGTLFKSGYILYGKLRPYLNNWLLPKFEGVALGDFWVFNPKNNDSNYIFYLIQSQKYQKVANDTTGTKMPRSDWKIVSSTKFQIPSILEQQAIGAFFANLDDIITSYQDKIDSLESLKKKLLKDMFI
ncbi:restriction endonuclease subunit S [Streptococcus pacificus]|uniref:Restriction endonuclease subunit S n=1 Tax=Streptococcus pacificus TaxID=2740577 RepID=A0ABS0ZK30_9STRE|nr:restriction endonuclease subunit S [Streptococcus pacificus]MBJ8326381.1 restriction endonuclease subunit S [Streptococcus pacificus]